MAASSFQSPGPEIRIPSFELSAAVSFRLEYAMTVNTAKVTGRRQLHFSSVDEILAEVDRLAAGPHRMLGNWSFGQILWHLATVMNSSIDGSSIRPGFIMRLLGPLMKGRMLSKGMSPGFQLPANMLKVFGPPPTSEEDGLKVIREAIRRQKTETHREPSPFLGKMTDAEYVQLHCRHAELHLSFAVAVD